MIALAPAMRAPWIAPEPTPPQPDDDHDLAGAHLRAVDRGAEARRQPAADRARRRAG